MYNLIQITSNIFDVIVTVMMLSGFLIWRKEGILIRIISGLFMFVSTFICNLLTRDETMTAIFSLIILILTTIAFNGRLIRKIFVVFGYMGLVMVADLLTTVIMFSFADSNIVELMHASGSDRMLAMVISKPLILCLVKLILIFSNKYSINIYIKYWIPLFTVPIASIIILLSITNALYGSGAENTSAVTVSSISVLYMDISIFYLFDRIINNMILSNKCEALENQITIQAEQYKHDSAEISKFTSIRHDSRIHFQMLYDLLDQGYIETAKNYLSDLDIVSKNNCNKVHTGNIALDAILNSKSFEAEKKDIFISCICKVPHDLAISDTDTAILFGNLLDNSIEGCLRSKQANKYIDIHMRYDKHCLVCSITNTADADKIKKEGDDLISSKDNSSEHGIGLQNIKEVIFKYDGIFRMTNDLHSFTVELILFGV